jgi:hypothetical protein
MMPYNPLDKRNIGGSVAKELLFRSIEQLPPAPFAGAGVYAIYYTGEHQRYPLYDPIATHGQEPELAVPIYVGKAVPAGARIGGFGLDALPGNVLSTRLREHGESIRQATNLDLRDFHCRYLTVDDIWIALAESVLIEMFAPIWNTTIAGFGNHDPGSGRYNQQRSAWDVLHPGRPWAERVKPNQKSEAEIIALAEKAFEVRRAQQQTNEE